jgi:hypothetical protein
VTEQFGGDSRASVVRGSWSVNSARTVFITPPWVTTTTVSPSVTAPVISLQARLTRSRNAVTDSPCSGSASRVRKLFERSWSGNRSAISEARNP